MRAWLYDTLTNDEGLADSLGVDLTQMDDHVTPRQGQDTINLPKPFLVYGLGNATNEDIAEDTDHIAFRQFFEIWIHDEGGDYSLIDGVIPVLIKLLVGKAAAASQVTTIRWLETSGEFANETYNTIFRYVRFQAIISKGEAA